MKNRRKMKGEARSRTFSLVLAGAFLFSAAVGYLVVSFRDSTTTQDSPHASSWDSYAGSHRCQECHREIYTQWQSSHHALAERNLSSATDHAAFTPSQKIKHGAQTSEVREENGTFQLLTTSRDKRWQTFPLARVVGVEPLRQFLVPTDGGRFQTTELAFDPERQEWFDIFGNEDRQPGEWGHWTGRGMTWNAMCANCHNTRVRKNYEAAFDRYATDLAEMGVGCEACHGPMQSHVAGQRNPRGAKHDPTYQKLTREQHFDACGTCHARRSELTGNFVPGESFFDHHGLTIPDETDIFYPDGQVRDEDYEFTSFLSSKMHAAGVRCVDCHNPHSGKTKLPGDLLCLQCHNGSRQDAPVINPALHIFHQPNTPGSRCVDCHMPQTTYMQRHARRDHGFTIPDPLLTKQHGIPNACQRCHADKSTDWALAHTEKWYGEKMNRATRERASWLAQARSGATNLAPQLIGLLRNEKLPLWRASLVALLQPSLADPKVMPTILSQTSDAHPLVRSSAAKAMTPLVEQNFAPAETALRALLDDPIRSVRIDAAWALRANLDTNTTAGRDLLAYLAHNADQPAGALQLGHFFLARNDLPSAIHWLERAAQWDPHSAPLRHDYAVVLNLAGKNAETILQLREAIRLAPKEAEYHYKLALALHESGDLLAATGALEQSVKLDAHFSRAWYNLGLAYAAGNRLEEGIKALEQAEALDVRSAEIPYARATVLQRAGLKEEARAAAQLALDRDPSFTAASDFLR